MYYTARQLQDLAGTNDSVVLPYRARLTPLAKDWIKRSGLTIGYGEAVATKSAIAPAEAKSAATSGGYLWWCDSPAGVAKAAVAAVAREANLSPIGNPADPREIVNVIRHCAAELKAGRSAGAILLVQSGATAMVYANRCPSLRAVLGTCRDSVEQGLKLVGANVLVIEHPYKTLMETRNMLGRFVRGPRTMDEELKVRLAELGKCD